MEINLVRKSYTTKSTIGDFSIEDKMWFSLEDVARKIKIYGETAIPAGKYHIVPQYSPLMKRILPMLENVPNFTYIYIHPLNYATESLGCIGIGKIKDVDSIYQSQQACAEVFDLICLAWQKKEDVWITIEDTQEPI